MEQLRRDQMARAVHDSRIQIIDVRAVNAYNGWPEKGCSRGGHIQGAKSLPAKWADYIDWIEIVRQKEIKEDDPLFLYGSDSDETDMVADLFTRAGWQDVHVYHNFVDEWCPDAALPLQKLSRYTQLVSPQWLHGLTTTGTTQQFEGNRFVLCHAHYRNPDDYHQGHIPGAIDIDTNSLESTETWNRRSPQELAGALQALGITCDTPVILYGRFSYPDNDDPYPGSSAGHLGAIRCAFLMLYAGVKDVRILNGGLQSWLDAGYETTTDPSEKHPVEDFGTKIPSRPDLVIDTPQAKQYLDAPDKNLVSVRSWKEYIGEVSGYNYIEKKGRIPGSVFADCGSDAYHMENYRNLDHTTREYHEIERLWKNAGITPDTYNAFYCGTGWRGSEAFLNAWLMGWPDISVYDGGWFEWSNNGNPYETGEPDGTGRT